MILSLTPGDHTVKWTLNGYNTLEAVINVSVTGIVTCKSVTGSTCGATASPAIRVTGTTVTGLLQIIPGTQTPTPAPTPITTPTPTPAPGQITYCTWVTGKGGWKNASAMDIMDLVKGYSRITNLGFTVTAVNIMAHAAYYSGKGRSDASRGNGLSGCGFT